MKKRTKILIIIGVLVVVLGYLGYKTINLIYYHSFDYEYNVVDDFEIEDTIRLNYHKELEMGEEYLRFKNIKIRNDFKDFEYREDISTDDNAKYVLYDGEDNVKASFWIGIVDSYVSMLKGDIEIYANNRRGINLDGIEEFLKSKGISNDIHLLNYLVEHKDDKNNLFTSVKEIKGRYVLSNLIEFMFPKIEEITLINGTYAGYIMEVKEDVKQVGILYYDKCYVFTFVGDDYFSDEYIYDLLDTLVIGSALDESGKVDLSKYESSTFTRTYNIIGVVENNSLDYDSFEIKQFQGEETVVVDIKKYLVSDIEVGKSYEFTFKKTSEIEDNIKSIFDNTELVSVVETDKVGLEQVQESID